MDVIIVRTWMLWEHGCYHRADMNALVVTLRGHGCSGHSHATKARSVANTDFLHGRYHRADMDALATRTQWSHERYHRADMDALGGGNTDVVIARHECSGNMDAIIVQTWMLWPSARNEATKCRKCRWFGIS